MANIEEYLLARWTRFGVLAYNILVLHHNNTKQGGAKEEGRLEGEEGGKKAMGRGKKKEIGERDDKEENLMKHQLQARR